jgi:Cytochrome c554 and c-prime
VRICFFLVPVLFTLVAVLSIAGPAQTPATIAEQLTTAERITRSKWWPTKGNAPRTDYAGSGACAECHFAMVKSQARHSMAKASVPAAASDILRDHAGQSFRLDAYEYKIVRQASGAFEYSVADSAKVTSRPLSWAFGAGKVGQSYLSEQDGKFHEIRFSYFESLHSFGVTPNQAQQAAVTMDKADSRVLAQGEAERCFGCHTTASKNSNHFEPGNAMAGISCEGCHGPGAKHAVAMKAGDLDVGLASIFNPRELKPVDKVDFCGACHMTWWDAKGIGANGVANVRFQPYRLESSRCWGKGDARLTCAACHNPHQPLVREAGSYDTRCLSCHVSAGAKITAEHPGAACPVGKQDCVTCHMQKYEVPDMHYKYTDHRIRVVKAGEAFPD